MDSCGDFFSKTSEISDKIRVKLLRAQKFAVCAESCTGGLVASRLSGVSGSSKVFAGGIVAYQNSVKMRVLSVSKGVIDEYSEVSPECALQMAEGVLSVFPEADFAVSTTGFLDDNTPPELSELSRTAYIGLAKKTQGGEVESSFHEVKIPRVNRLLSSRFVAMRAMELLLREI